MISSKRGPFSCLVPQNSQSWKYSSIQTFDPSDVSGHASGRTASTTGQTHIGMILTRISSKWVTVNCISTRRLPKIVSQRERDSGDLSGFLFPKQVADLMIVETMDLVSSIVPINWLGDAVGQPSATASGRC